MFLYATVGVELLSTTHADKHMANVLPNLVLVMRWQRLEILVADNREVNPVSLRLSLIPPPTNLPLTPAGPGANI